MQKTFMNRLTERFPKLKTLLTPAGLACLAMLCISAVVTFCIFRGIFAYELHHAYTADAPLYWSVGRGMLNGLTPYADMYENKPPGVFLIAALSFGVTGETILCNIVSCIAALMLTALPALILLGECRRTDQNDTGAVKKWAVLLTVLLSGLLITAYTEARSGGFQVEAIGAAFSVLFICLVIRQERAKTRKGKIVLTVLSALAVSCAVMIKEPFLLVSVFGALLFVDSVKSFIERILLPCAAGGVLVIILLAVSGVIVPYFSIYISRMFETRIAGESSAFGRALDIFSLAGDLREFSRWLLYLLLLFFVLTLLRAIYKKQSDARLVIHVIKVIAAIFAASFCVGMGGQYYNHHFIFAVPVYCAFVIYGGRFLLEFRFKKPALNGTVILLWGLILLTVIPKISNTYDGDYTERYDSITKKAQYVDSLLDYYGEERYQYIGFNGEDVFIGLTQHSPQGPVFAQDPDNLTDDDTWFAQQLMDQLDKSNIVIVQYLFDTAVSDDILATLESDFSTVANNSYETLPPEDFGCTVYYRISEYG